MNKISDSTAKRLYRRIEWLRNGQYGGKAEPFNPDRVRELFYQRTEETQYIWLELVGKTPLHRPAPNPSRIGGTLMTSLG